MPKQRYDVFLSHNSNDKPVVEILARKLKQSGVTPWLDKWNLIPGRPWQPAIEQALEECAACAVFIGPQGTGPWQVEEMRAAINRRVTQTKGSFRVIPVLLPNSKKIPLPAFLSATTWVVFKRTIDDKQAFHRLLAGISDVPPGDTDAAQPREFTEPERIDVVIKVTGSVEAFKQATLAAQHFLQKTLGDPKLTIKYVRSGSVLITIECSEKAFIRLQVLFHSRSLKELAGFPIESAERAHSKALPVGSSTVDVSRDRRSLLEQLKQASETREKFLEKLAATLARAEARRKITATPSSGEPHHVVLPEVTQALEKLRLELLQSIAKNPGNNPEKAVKFVENLVQEAGKPTRYTDPESLKLLISHAAKASPTIDLSTAVQKALTAYLAEILAIDSSRFLMRKRSESREPPPRGMEKATNLMKPTGPKRYN